jgi:hypothetical protein
MEFCGFSSVRMARAKKPVQLTPVDDRLEQPKPIRLENLETGNKQCEPAPIRLGFPAGETMGSQRLNLPSKDETELRTHQPGVEVILDTDSPGPERLEQGWGENATKRKPIPWGWFALIALAITAALVWSTARVKNAKLLAEQIRMDTQTTLGKEAKEQREATQLIERIEQTLRNFFNITSAEALTQLARQPERVAPLIRQYYAGHALAIGQLKSIDQLVPLIDFSSKDLSPTNFSPTDFSPTDFSPTDFSSKDFSSINLYSNFWIASVTVANGTTHNLILEILESGEILIDWESWVCYQPMKWDDFTTQRPVKKQLDFRVFAERDHFFSHEFYDSKQWACFRLTAVDSEETLFGYAPATSDLVQSLDRLLADNKDQPIAPILRLSIPENLQSRRGVLIEKLISPRWVYLASPNPAP